MGESSTGGHLNLSKASHHINYLELLAAYFAILSFSDSIPKQHVKIPIDNTTAVCVLNSMRICHHDPCSSIWDFCEEDSEPKSQAFG